MMRYIAIFCFFLSLVQSSPLEQPTIEKLFLKDIDGRVINGQKATAGQFPWQVGIRFANANDSGFFCGGSLISEEWIVTAGHCAVGAFVAEVFVGAVELSLAPEIAAAYNIIVHEDYDPNSYANDIAVVQLTAPLTFSENKSAIALASDPLAGGVEITVSGWGVTSDGDTVINNDLNYITVTTIENTACSEIYGDFILEEMVCAVGGTNPITSPCFGDSGGPAVANAGTDPVLVAITSFVSPEGCEVAHPSGYTRTAYYRDWIKTQTGI